MRDLLQPQDTDRLQRLKEQGRQYLRQNQIDKALRIFSGILSEYPQDVDSMLVLGDAYLVVNERQAALAMYREASRVFPERRDIQRRIEMLAAGDQVDGTSAPAGAPTDPQAVAHLIQRLTGRATPVSEEEVIKAGSLLDAYLKSPSPALAVAEHLDEIDVLLPALIEINIRQARADGKTDLADSLQNLLANVLLQLDLQTKNTDVQTDVESPILSKQLRIVAAGFDSHESPYRLGALVDALSYAGYYLTRETEAKSQSYQGCDLMIVRNPHIDQNLMRGMASAAACGIPIVVDFDMDFEMLPIEHPDHEKMGMTTTERVRSYQAVLQLADMVCVASEGLADVFRNKGCQTEVLPEGWSQQNHLWLRPPSARLTVNLGLNLLRGQLQDVAPIRRAIIRVLREFPHTRLVIYGDIEAYQLFDSVPEARKTLLPPADVDDYPGVLAQMDVVLVPMYDTAFNQLRSDRRLVEAGIRRLPWVASPIASHLLWGSGGLIAYTLDEWYTNMQSLVQDEELRARLAKAGHQKAMLRESQSWSKAWQRVIRKVLTMPNARKKS
ncbi:MAG: hypothetical protein HPY45_01495 [Anaerolineae bacterium]|nr:hypothetical protein [Anaerolineae bacterium]